MDGKAKAIIAHITLIGWIIAFLVNMNEKDEFASYYIRQLLGLYLAAIVFNLIPRIGWVVSVIIFAFWILSLIGAIQGEKKETPLIGKYFQEWFNSL